MPGAIVFTGQRPAPVRRKSEITHETGLPSFGVVYVNSLARDALNNRVLVRFPEGSIIVREKLAKADDAQPQLVTAMIKRRRGFNPKANNWEFLAVDGTMNNILLRQKKGGCLECHASQAHRDFVYAVPLN